VRHVLNWENPLGFLWQHDSAGLSNEAIQSFADLTRPHCFPHINIAYMSVTGSKGGALPLDRLMQHSLSQTTSLSTDGSNSRGEDRDNQRNYLKIKIVPTMTIAKTGSLPVMRAGQLLLMWDLIQQGSERLSTDPRFVDDDAHC
jgi:hypothetical protein